MKTNNNKNNIQASVSTFVKEYNKDAKTFNTQIRFLFHDFAKRPEKKLPASPAKDDKSEEAKQLRKEIREITAYNNAIKDAKAIFEILDIKEGDLKAKAIGETYKKVLARCKNVTKEGYAVKFSQFPALMKDVAGIKNYRIVKVMSNFEILMEAANMPTDANRKEYEPTLAPVTSLINEEYVTESAKGDIVNENGLKLVGPRYDEIIKIWNDRQRANYFANKTGRETADAERNETIKGESLAEVEQFEELTDEENNAIKLGAMFQKSGLTGEGGKDINPLQDEGVEIPAEKKTPKAKKEVKTA